MKRTIVPAVSLMVGLSLAACGPDHRTDREELAGAAIEERGYATDEPAPVVPVPDTAGGQTMTGNLAEMGRSGVSGVITLRPDDGRTVVELSATGAEPQTQLRPTVHRGACDEAGELVRELDAVVVETTGLATATLDLGVPVEQVADGRHSVRLYPAGGLQVPPLACAELPAAVPASPI